MKQDVRKVFVLFSASSSSSSSSSSILSPPRLTSSRSSCQGIAVGLLVEERNRKEKE